MIGIIIPTKDNTIELFECIRSIKQHTSIEHRLYVADTGSTIEIKEQTIELLDELYDDYKFIEYDYYNFAKINNDVVKNHLDVDVDTLVFCNNDINIVTDNLIDKMVNVFHRDINIGTVGCRLLYNNNTIQHDGQFIAIINNSIGSKRLVMTHNNINKSHSEIHRPLLNRVDGNTFALVVTSRKLFEDIGMLNESYRGCFEDVEYNLECVKRGLSHVILSSDNWSYHYESLSRGNGDKTNKLLQLDYPLICEFVHSNFDVSTFNQRGGK